MRTGVPLVVRLVRPFRSLELVYRDCHQGADHARVDPDSVMHSLGNRYVWATEECRHRAVGRRQRWKQAKVVHVAVLREQAVLASHLPQRSS